MNEQELINKLTLLKSIQPHHTVLKNIKKDIDQQMRTESKIKPKYHYASYGAAFVLLLVIFMSVSTGLLPIQIHKIIFYSRLATAPNQYEKASIALAETTDSYGNSEAIDTKKISDVSQSISLANNELSKLKLKGENGKYTALQCHQLYQKYLNYLEKESTNIPTENQQSYSSLKSQIVIYKELAERKLHMYSNL